MRPELNLDIEPDKFMDFYWLKEELFQFCIENRLPTSGCKDEIAKRIYAFLKTGEILYPTKKRKVQSVLNPLSLDSVILEGYKNDERHRAYFKSEIGEHFKFNVIFMNWMKENHGKTYRDAIVEWNKISLEKKTGKKTVISSQFQYNQYTRDFFDNNPGLSRKDAIKCWMYKKSLPGHNIYEDIDLKIIN